VLGGLHCEEGVMSQIVLSDDQARTVRTATGPIEVRDRQGDLLGYVSPPPSDAEVAEARRRLVSNGPWYTTGQVIDHLKSLEQG
jgi:hypothetical protein